MRRHLRSIGRDCPRPCHPALRLYRRSWRWNNPGQKLDDVHIPACYVEAPSAAAERVLLGLRGVVRGEQCGEHHKSQSGMPGFTGFASPALYSRVVKRLPHALHSRRRVKPRGGPKMGRESTTLVPPSQQKSRVSFALLYLLPHLSLQKITCTLRCEMLPLHRRHILGVRIKAPPVSGRARRRRGC